MGLAERKAVAALKDTDYKTFEKKVSSLCGFDIPLTVDWAALENHPQCIWICENKKYNVHMFEPVIDALTAIVADKMGKDAVKDGLKKIMLIPKSGDLEFAQGTLTVRSDLAGSGAYDTEAIQAALEKGL